MIPSSRMGGGMGHSKVIPNPNPKWPHSLLPPGTAPIPCWGMLLSPPTGMMEKFRVGFGVHGQQEPQGDPQSPGGQLPNLTGAWPPPPPARDYHKLRRNYSMEIYSTKLRR